MHVVCGNAAACVPEKACDREFGVSEVARHRSKGVPQYVGSDAIQFGLLAHSAQHLPNPDEMAIAAIGRKKPISVPAQALGMQHINRSTAKWPYLRPAFRVWKIHAACIQQPGAFNCEGLITAKAAKEDKADHCKARQIVAFGSTGAHGTTQHSNLVQSEPALALSICKLARTLGWIFGN